jgi:WD40 repeat protein
VGPQQVALRERLVEVVADFEDGRTRYSSGCIVVGSTVLTAAHAVYGATRVRVRGTDKNFKACEKLNSLFVGSPGSWREGPDLALLTISADEHVNFAPMPLARVDRDSNSGDEVDRCHALGYPQFAEVQPGGSEGPAVRESKDAAGSVPVGSGLVSGLLDLQVSVAPKDLPPTDEPLPQSQWSGISGGPVVAGDYLLGVVSEHAPRSGPSSLSITPLTAISFDPAHPGWGPGMDNSDSWWRCLGIDGPGSLTVLPRRAQAPYMATLRAMGRAWRSRLPRLEGREAELEEIIAFATSDHGYRWLVGSAFTGKSALMYYAVTAALPDNVVVVSYFLRRTASDSDSSGFLGAVIPQLAAIIGSSPPMHFDSHTYRELWEAAVLRTAEKGKHLLLVVDALDEDVRPAGIPSVASLLPDLVRGTDAAAAHVHVHVTSRPSPELPQDVAAIFGHPLTKISPENLVGFRGWEKLRDLGLAEIDELVELGGLARDILGFLAAARGPLTFSDLATLVQIRNSSGRFDEWAIKRVLTNRVARSLEAITSMGSTSYQFAHATLLEHAQIHPALAEADYRGLLHEWAEKWKQAGWPWHPAEGTPTPFYLLRSYTGTLSGELERLTRLTVDVAWLEAAIRMVGVTTVLGILRQASADDFEVEAIHSLVSLQAHHLMDTEAFQERGYVLRQLCLEACRRGMRKLANEMRQRMQSLPEPRLIPIWTSMERQPAFQLGYHESFRAMAVSPHGLVATCGLDNLVLLMNPQRPGEPAKIGHHVGWGKVLSLAWSSQGSLVSGGTDGRVLLWDPDRLEEPDELGRCEDWIHAVTVTGEGLVVSGGYDGRVLLWDPKQRGEPTVIGRHETQVEAVAMTPEGKVISAGRDGRLLLCDPTDPEAVNELGRRESEIGSPFDALAVTPQGKVVSAGTDGRVLLWNLEEPGEPVELGYHYAAVITLELTPVGQVISASEDGGVFLWDPEQRVPPVEIGRHEEGASGAVVTPQGLVVSAGFDGRILVWDQEPGDEPSARDYQLGLVDTLAWTSQGKLVTPARGRLLLWDLERSEQPVELSGCDDFVRQVSVTPRHVVACAGPGGKLLLWTPQQPTNCSELAPNTWNVNYVAGSPRGHVVSGGWDGRLLLWDPDNPGEPVEVGQVGLARTVAVTPHGHVVSGDFDGRVLLWDVEDPGEPIELGRHDGIVLSLAVAPWGDVVSGGDDGRVLLWNSKQPGKPIELGCHDSGVMAVAWTSQGFVISGGQDDRVLLWDSKQPGKSIIQIRALVGDLKVSPDAAQQRVAVAGQGVSIWRI